MIKGHEATEVFEEPPAGEQKFRIIIVLSILLGVFLVIIVAGGLVFFQKTQELGAQVRVVKNELKEKCVNFRDAKSARRAFHANAGAQRICHCPIRC